MELRVEVRQRLRTARNWHGLMEELEREVDQVAPAEAKAARLFELGQVCEDLFLRKDRAMVHYQAAFRLSPQDARSLERARRIYWEMGNLEMVANLLGLEQKVTRDEAAQAALEGQLGIVLLDLGRVEAALPHLRASAAAGTGDSEVADALAAAEYDREDWLSEAERLTLKAAGAEPHTAARLYLRVARIYHLEVPADPAYVEALEKTLAHAPQHEHANFLLEGAYGSAQRFDDVIRMHERRASAAADRHEQAELYRRFASMWALRWNDVERAAYFYRKALEAYYGEGPESGARFPGHLAAFGFLREIDGSRGEWGRLLALADMAMCARLDDDELAILATQAGLISWKEMKDADKARGYFARVQQLHPESEELRAFIRDVGNPASEGPTNGHGRGSGHDRDGDGELGHTQAHGQARADANADAHAPADAHAHTDAHAHVQIMARNEEIDDALKAQMESARNAENLGLDKGIDAWRRIMVAHPRLRAPRRELERLYRQAERWNALIELLKEEVEKLPDTTPEEKLGLLFAMVDVYREKLKLDVMVINTYNAILQLKPGDPAALDALAAQYERMKRWPDLIGALQKKAQALEPGPEQVPLYLRIAALYQEKFSNVAEAIKAYEKALELDPSNQEAITYLKANYEKRRDWEKLIAVHKREIERIEDAALRGQRYVEVAKLASEKLKKPAVSIELWSRVVETNPDHLEGLAELEKLYEREKQWEKLAEVCQRQADLLEEPGKKVPMLQKLGILFSDKMNHPERAITAWRALLVVEPENKRAQDALKKLYLAERRYDDLEGFYAAHNKYDEYIRVLERQVETEDASAKLALGLKVAELYRDRLHKADRARAAFERVLALDPHNLAAAEALIPLYEAAKDSRKLAAALEIQLGRTDGRVERVERMRRLGQLSEQGLKDKPAAYGWYLKVFGLEPQAAWVREEVERLARETGTWAELVQAYEAAEAGLEPAERLPLALVVARVYEEELGEPDAALKASAQILEIDADNQQAIAALERLYLRTERYADLLGIYQKKLHLESDKQAQKEIRYRIASIFELEVKDDKKAIAAYQAILEDHGEELEAYRALDRIYTATEQWEELGRVIARELELLGPDDGAAAADLRFRLGSIDESHLGDVAGAIAQFAGILKLDPGHTGAREALERRLGEKKHQLKVAGLLEPLYQAREEWPRLIEVREIQLGRESDPVRRGELLLGIGELWATRIGDADRAFAAYSRCFAEDPANQAARAELERLTAILEGWPQLVALYETAVEKLSASETAAPALQRELYLKLARAYDDRLENPEKAIEYYRSAQSIEADDRQALEALEKLYTRAERWPELIEVYRKKVELSPEPETREQIYFQMAYLWEEILQNLDEAIATYREILHQDSANVKALKALDRLYQGQRQWHELADNLSRQLQLTDDKTETIELLVRLAALREKELGEVAAAVDTYRQVLELDTDNDQALLALERMAQLKEHELQVAAILEPIYKARDEWQRLVDTYEILARHAMDPARKIQLLHQIGELYEIAGEDGNRAFATYDRALREEPGLKETQTRLDRLARQLDRWKDLVGIYHGVVEQVAGSSGDRELQVQLLTKVAHIEETQLGDNDAAAAALHRVLEIAPHNLEAANALESIYLRADAYTKLVEVVLSKVEIVTSVAEKKELCFKAAQIYEEVLENADRAIDVYRQILAVDDSDRAAMDALERLYIHLERWDPLKDVYAKKAELATTPDEKKQMLFVLGQVYDRELGDMQRAIETYQAVLDLDPEEVSAIQALDRLYTQAERWYDLLQILDREVELASSTAETVSLKYRIGQLWEKELKDLSRAVTAYREVLVLDGTHTATLAALDGLVHGEQEPVLAAQVLEPIFESGAEWERLVDVLEVMVRHSDDPLRRIELLHRIADYQERCLEQPELAFRAFGRALREDSRNQTTLGHLERLADATHGFAELAALYEAELGKLLDVARQVEMLLRVARVYEEELGQADKAVSSYLRVVEAEPDNRDAILALDRLYQQGERWTELADVLRREIRLAPSDEEVVALEFRLGQLYEQNLRDLDSAVDVYSEILTADAGHGPTLAALEMLFADGVKALEIAGILEPLYRAAEQWEKLVKIHEVQLEKLTGPDERLAMIQRIAEIHEHKLLDQPAAFVWWAQAVREAPSSEMALEEAERLAGAGHAWEDLVTVYSTVLGERDDRELKRSILLRLARAYESELNDQGRAEETYQGVLAIEPRDPQALEALDRLYDASSMWRELSQVLEKRIEVTTATDELIELHFRLGGLNADALAEPERAVAAYQAVLELDSRNRRALEALERSYFQRQAWPELYAVYENMVDIAPGDQAMAECYARMAKLASDGLGEAERAVDLWGRVLDLRGEDPVALGALADLHEQASAWRELVGVLERTVRITPEPERQIPIYRRLGWVWGEKLNRGRNALDAWNKVLELDPGDVPALRALALLYRQTQAWEELAETLHKLMEVGEAGVIADQELIELYAELGALKGEILMRPQEAIDAWQRVLRLDPRDFRALGALEQLFTQEARWEECIEVLERKAAALDEAAAKVEVLLQAASVWEDKIGDRQRAGGVYERILQLDPRSLTASLALEQIYRQAAMWEKLVELLLGRVEFTAEPEQRIAILQSVAEIYEKELGDQEGAFVVLQAAFRENYADPAVSAEIERLATASNKWNDLLGEYTQVVQTITDPRTAADLWVKIGRWYGEHLGHVEYAIASEQQALTLDPNHKEALSALADFYRKTARWPELVSTLARHAELEEEPARRVDLFLAMADLWEGQLGDPAQAIAAYRRALEADAGTIEALSALERLYRRQQEWPQLIEILQQKASIVEDTEQVIALKHDIGTLYEERLGSIENAIASYCEILTVDPQNLAALKALERLYEQTGAMEKYLDVLEQQLDISGTNEERISLYQRMAVAWEEQFRKPERAWEALEKILLIDDRHLSTLASLERIYRQERRWSELVETLRKHILATSEEAARVKLYADMGQVYEEELKDLDRAIEAYSDILSFDADQGGALAALFRLYEKIEEWDRAIDRGSRLVEITQDRDARVDILERIGRIHQDRLQDGDTAEARYMEALALDPAFVPAMTSLTALYQGRGDWLKAAQMMVRAEEHTHSPLEKTRMLYEAGRTYREKLGNEQRGGELFARVLELDPEHVEAGEPLQEIYFREQAWQKLEPIIDMLVRKAGRRDNRELNQLYYRLARAADENGNHEKALKYYKSAYDLDSTYLPTLLGRAALLYKMQDWDGAFKIYQTVLVNHRDSQKEAEIVDIFYRLGNIKLKQGERKKALNMFEKALELESSHRPTLQSVIELQTQQNDFEAVIHAKRSLLQVADEAEKLKLLDEIGDIYHQNLQNPQKAVAAYLDALEVKADNHILLHKVLDLYSETKQWKKAIEIITRIAELESDPVRKGKYYHAAARILRDEVKSLDDAIEYFNKALDCYFQSPDKAGEANAQEYLKPFEAIDKICTNKKDWKSQERNYRKMLKRMPAEGFDSIKVALWHALGEIYRSRLKQMGGAIQAFEVAAKLDPDNQARHEILAELYILVGGEHAPKAVQEHMTLIRREPFREQSYKALRKLYMETRQYDQAWCVCAALAFLKKADAEETQFYEQYRHKGFVRAKSRLTEELWTKAVLHPDEDRYLGAIFAAVWQAVALLRSGDHKQFGIKRKDRRDLGTDQALFSKVFNYVTQVLNVPPPEVYFRPENQGGMQLANTKEKGHLIPSLVVGAEMLQGRGEKELAFPIAKFLTMVRPEHYLRLIIQTNTELGVAFLAAIKLVQAKFPVPPAQAATVEQYVQAMRAHVQPAWLEQLALVVQRFIQTKGAIDLGRWSQAVDLTAHRAGFLIANDLELAARVIQMEPVTVGGMSARDKIKELVLYSISPEYFDLRHHLGLTIG